MSGTECIRVLGLLGYQVHARAAGLTSLRRGPTTVVVPESATLNPSLVAAICRAAEVDPLEFLRAAEELPPAAESAPGVA